ncbi:hypothetical protein NP493_986g00036 [Ridgeia piscesae]|uniref:Uncharacterized protein n=1 Tax=Ridgeia piscesae TaxID=27915 RepID=A0AAD9KK61_RIDPI|nr:hypothetical protein NP493_986g00036 [Ridgeia piscesae]
MTEQASTDLNTRSLFTCLVRRTKEGATARELRVAVSVVDYVAISRQRVRYTSGRTDLYMVVDQSVEH